AVNVSSCLSNVDTRLLQLSSVLLPTEPAHVPLSNITYLFKGLICLGFRRLLVDLATHLMPCFSHLARPSPPPHQHSTPAQSYFVKARKATGPTCHRDAARRSLLESCTALSHWSTG